MSSEQTVAQEAATSVPRQNGKRGRRASRPGRIPFRGWIDILARVRRELARDRVSLVAAGVGFFALLAAFPALAGVVALFGLVSSPEQISRYLGELSILLPADVLTILNEQLTTLAAQGDSELGIAAVLGFATAVWSARKGTVATIQATTLAYEETSSRSYWHSLLLSLLFTLGSIVYFIIVVVFAVALPIAIDAVIDSPVLSGVVVALQYVVLWLFAALGLAVLYRYAPHRARAEWRWVVPGAAIAAALWMAASAGLAAYATHSATYEENYGGLGPIIVVMLWLYSGGYVLILGAEINAEMEHQTTVDSTEGPDKPMGQRGAYVADTVGKARGAT